MQQWAELWLYPVYLMLHAGSATGTHAGGAKSAFLASFRISPLNFPLEGMWQHDPRAVGVDLHHTDNCACAPSVHSECEVAALCLP